MYTHKSLHELKFQSTLPHGSDDDKREWTLAAKKFQSTLPHGSDVLYAGGPETGFDFNPRSLTGATIDNQIRVRVGEFQSTLPHGSDRYQVIRGRRQASISIHAPSRERLSRPQPTSQLLRFQSTLPHGSDRPYHRTAAHCQYFNPRSLTGATKVRTDIVKMQLNFNPRSLTGATRVYAPFAVT